jgi:hypothetical protein
MNNTLILVVGIVYLYVGYDLFTQHKIGLGLSFVFYALANLGLYLASKNI